MRFATIIPALTIVVSLSSVSWAAVETGETNPKITAEQVPAAAKATLDQQTAGLKVIAYEKGSRDMKPVYIAIVKEKGRQTAYVVSENGKLLATEANGDKDKKDK